MNLLFKTLIDRCMRMLRPKSAPPPEKSDAAPDEARPNNGKSRIHRMAPKKTNAPAFDPERPIQALRRQCREIAFKAGLDNPSEEQEPFIETSLREGATAVALTLSLSSEEFQMKDQQLQERIAKLDQELKVRLSDRQTAQANVRTLREELAALGSNPYPNAGAILRWSATVGISLSLAPTIHDFFPGLFQILRWLLAFGFSFAFSLLIVNAILPEDQPPQDSSLNKENPV